MNDLLKNFFVFIVAAFVVVFFYRLFEKNDKIDSNPVLESLVSDLKLESEALQNKIDDLNLNISEISEDINNNRMDILNIDSMLRVSSRNINLLSNDEMADTINSIYYGRK